MSKSNLIKNNSNIVKKSDKKLKFHKVFIYIIIPLMIVEYFINITNATRNSNLIELIIGIIGILLFIYLFYLLYREKKQSILFLKVVLIINLIFWNFTDLHIEKVYVIRDINIQFQIIILIIIRVVVYILIGLYYERNKSHFKN